MSSDGYLEIGLALGARKPVLLLLPTRSRTTAMMRGLVKLGVVKRVHFERDDELPRAVLRIALSLIGSPCRLPSSAGSRDALEPAEDQSHDEVQVARLEEGCVLVGVEPVPQFGRGKDLLQLLRGRAGLGHEQFAVAGRLRELVVRRELRGPVTANGTGHRWAAPPRPPAICCRVRVGPEHEMFVHWALLLNVDRPPLLRLSMGNNTGWKWSLSVRRDSHASTLSLDRLNHWSGRSMG
jgi:hypothetical protein